MKYFTKEWYTEMRVAGFLVFPEKEEEWRESIEYYKREGIDFKQQFKEDLESRKEELLKHLPKSFHPYINDYTINSEYPSEELKKMAAQWQKDYNERMEKLDIAYIAHYNSIKSKLPKNVTQLHENSLHDVVVKSIDVISPDILIITLDCTGGFHYFTDIKLTFTEVKEFSIPEQFEGAWWLYDEVYLTEKGFELHILFDCPFTEVTISAGNVWIEQV